MQGTRVLMQREKKCNTAPANLVILLSVRRDQYAVQCKTREGRTARVSLFSHLENRIGSTSRHPALRPGRNKPTQSALCRFYRLTRALPTKSNDQPTMNSFLQFAAAMVAAGSFGVAFVQTAMVEPLQQHSGTQSYVRVIR